METMFAVFSDHEEELIFWGAFSSMNGANSALEEFVKDKPYWSLNEFVVKELPFGVLL